MEILPDGTVNVTAAPSIGGTSAPTPSPIKGQLYRECIPLAIGRFTQTGTADPVLVWGVNIFSAVRNSLGNYTVTLVVAGAAVGTMAVQVSSGTERFLWAVPASSSTVAILVADLATGSADDMGGGGFTITVWGV